jgi:hypothetical protein
MDVSTSCRRSKTMHIRPCSSFGRQFMIGKAASTCGTASIGFSEANRLVHCASIGRWANWNRKMLQHARKLCNLIFDGRIHHDRTWPSDLDYRCFSLGGLPKHYPLPKLSASGNSLARNVDGMGYLQKKRLVCLISFACLVACHFDLKETNYSVALKNSSFRKSRWAPAQRHLICFSWFLVGRNKRSEVPAM